jgi:hypothetical protein
MSFPEPLKQREDYVFDSVMQGNFEARWCELSRTAGDHEIKLQVFEDALKVDGVRVNVSATLQQRLADVFDASLMTALVADLVFVSAPRGITPCPMPISTTVASMLQHSKNVDDKLKYRGGEGLASPVGKHWILDKKMLAAPGRACNYGWHFVGSSYSGIVGFPAASTINTLQGKPVRVIQPNATAHDPLHSDYSQVCQLVSQTCWVDGKESRFSEVLADPELCGLVTDQGAFDFSRQPGVPEIKGKLVLLPTVLTP